MTELHQVLTAHRPTTEPRAVSKLSVGGSANRSLTVAAPADGSRLLRSRAREQAVSSKIPLRFLKKEVFSQTRQPAAQHPGNTARVREGFSNSEGTACRPRPHQPQTTKQTQFRRPQWNQRLLRTKFVAWISILRSAAFAPPRPQPIAPVPQVAFIGSRHRPRNQDSRHVKASDSSVAHTPSVPRRDSSRRPGLAVSGGPPAGETQPGVHHGQY